MFKSILKLMVLVLGIWSRGAKKREGYKSEKENQDRREDVVNRNSKSLSACLDRLRERARRKSNKRDK